MGYALGVAAGSGAQSHSSPRAKSGRRSRAVSVPMGEVRKEERTRVAMLLVELGRSRNEDEGS